MPRANLASLLSDAPAGPDRSAPPEPAEAPEPVTNAAPRRFSSAASNGGSPGTSSRRPAPEPAVQELAPEVAPAPGPRYLQLERKELRLRVDQADELARLTRRLNRARRGTGERITDNTLIRVAVDLLLHRTAHLHGATEDELRDSVSRGLPRGADVADPGPGAR